VASDHQHHRLAGRVGALRLHARHDGRLTTAAGRAAFLSRFETEVDPDATLPVEERRRRADFARRAYFADLARRSAQARRRADHDGFRSGGPDAGQDRAVSARLTALSPRVVASRQKVLPHTTSSVGVSGFGPRGGL
jgi:hypothetical protein